MPVMGGADHVGIVDGTSSRPVMTSIKRCSSMHVDRCCSSMLPTPSTVIDYVVDTAESPVGAGDKGVIDRMTRRPRCHTHSMPIKKNRWYRKTTTEQGRPERS